MRHRLLASATLAVAVGPLAAADLRFTDLRVAVGIGESATSADVDYDAGSHSAAASGRGDVDLDRRPSARAQVGVVHARTAAWGGWFVGAGLDLAAGRLAIADAGSDHHFDDTGFSSLRVSVELGYAYAFTDRIHVEVGPTAGAGVVAVTWIDQDDVGRWRSETGGGASFAVGARLGVYGRIADHVVLGLSGGVERVYDRAEIDFGDTTGGEADLRLRHTDAYGSVVAGWRF